MQQKPGLKREGEREGQGEGVGQLIFTTYSHLKRQGHTSRWYNIKRADA